LCESQAAEIGCRSRFVHHRTQGVGATLRGIFEKDRTVSAELELNRSRRFTFDGDLLADDPQWFPRAVVANLVGVGGIDFFDEDIVLICARYREAPRQAVVVADMHPDKRGFAGADHVPARCVQVHDVAQRGGGDFAVRIVRHDWLAGGGLGAAHHPVVASRIRRLVFRYHTGVASREQVLIGGNNLWPRHAGAASTARRRDGTLGDRIHVESLRDDEFFPRIGHPLTVCFPRTDARHEPCKLQLARRITERGGA
jgi:hypothetical protein